MIDQKKVIKALEIVRDSNPYGICKMKWFSAINEPEYCMGQMIEDTIALLKEREEKISNYKNEYDAPKYLEVPFYRGLVLDHMQISCHMDDRRRKELEDPEKVWEETVRISKARTQKEIQARYAYYFGQLALLDYIKKMQNEYIVPQGK